MSMTGNDARRDQFDLLCCLLLFSILALPWSSHLLDGAFLPRHRKYSAASLAQAWEECAQAVSVAPPSARGGDEIQPRRNLAQPLGHVFLPTHDSFGAGPEWYDARPSLSGHLQLPATRTNGKLRKRIGSLSACS